MTERQEAITHAARHLRNREEIGHDLIVEALTETGHVGVIDEYDWPRLKGAICRKHEEYREIKRRAAEARTRLQKA